METAEELEQVDSLEEVLAGDAPTGETAQAESAPPAEETTEEQQPVEESKPAQTVPLGALKEERAKRQELEARLRQLETAQARANGPSKEELESQFLSDPIAFMQELAANQQQQLQEVAIQNRIALSEEMVREKYDDYDEYVQVFQDAAMRDPSLRQKLRTVSNPAKYAYETGKELAPKPDDFEARVKAAALKLLDEQGIRPSTASAIPKTTASARNASLGGQPVDNDDDLISLFGRGADRRP